MGNSTLGQQFAKSLQSGNPSQYFPSMPQLNYGPGAPTPIPRPSFFDQTSSAPGAINTQAPATVDQAAQVFRGGGATSFPNMRGPDVNNTDSRVPYTGTAPTGDIFRGQQTAAPGNPLSPNAPATPTATPPTGDQRANSSLRTNTKMGSPVADNFAASMQGLNNLYPQPSSDQLAQAALASRAFSSDQMGLYKALAAAGLPVNSMTGFQGALSPALQSSMQAAGGMGNYFAGTPYAAFFSSGK